MKLFILVLGMIRNSGLPSGFDEWYNIKATLVPMLLLNHRSCIVHNTLI
jgi:hypothetical protein